MDTRCPRSLLGPTKWWGVLSTLPASLFEREMKWHVFARLNQNFRNQKVWVALAAMPGFFSFYFGHKPTMRGGFEEIRECSRAFSTHTTTTPERSSRDGCENWSQNTASSATNGTVTPT